MGYVAIPREAVAVARCYEGFDAAVFLLYVHADDMHWRPFPCSDRWMMAKLGIAKRQCRALLKALEQSGCMELVDAGNEVDPRMVRLVRAEELLASDEVADRLPDRDSPALWTASRTANDVDQDSIVDRSPDRQPDRLPDRDSGVKRTKEAILHLTTQPPHRDHGAAGRVFDVWLSAWQAKHPRSTKTKWTNEEQKFIKQALDQASEQQLTTMVGWAFNGHDSYARMLQGLEGINGSPPQEHLGIETLFKSTKLGKRIQCAEDPQPLRRIGPAPPNLDIDALYAEAKRRHPCPEPCTEEQRHEWITELHPIVAAIRAEYADVSAG